ncbi:unnamed protein product, partial [Symbiodinium necroappetens]
MLVPPLTFEHFEGVCPVETSDISVAARWMFRQEWQVQGASRLPTLAVHAAVCMLGTVIARSSCFCQEHIEDYPRDPKDDEEKKVQEKSKQVLRSAVNPVLRE